MTTTNDSEVEKLLYKLVFQFSIFNQGSSEQLEPFLVSINKKLKQGVKYHNLTPELVKLSNTLSNISKQKTPCNDDLPGPIKLQNYLIERLKKLLATTTIPTKFQKQYRHFLHSSQTELANEQNNHHIIDLALSLLFNIKDDVLSEQQDLETFLTNFSMQFNLLEEQALDASKANQKSIENNSNLDKVVEQQIENIKNCSNNAEELSTLQNNITQHVQQLTSQYQALHQAENIQLRESQKQLRQMSKKLLELEVETDSLRNILKIAHDQAF